MEVLQNSRVQFNERSQQRSFPYQRLHPLCKEPIMQTSPMIYCTYDILYETRRRATDSVVYNITGKVFYEKYKQPRYSMGKMVRLTCTTRGRHASKVPSLFSPLGFCTWFRNPPTFHIPPHLPNPMHLSRGPYRAPWGQRLSVPQTSALVIVFHNSVKTHHLPQTPP